MKKHMGKHQTQWTKTHAPQHAMRIVFPSQTKTQLKNQLP